MSGESAIAFAVAVFVFSATPGPAILACIAQALGFGIRSALALAAGIVAGDVFFLLVRWLGSGYLVWLGWKLWMAEPAAAKGEPAVEASRRRGLQAGFLLTLGNPKVILFYLGFLPAFMDLDAMGGKDVAGVVGILVTVLMAVNATYAWTASRARTWVASASAVGRVNRLAGSVLMAIGIYVALENRS